MSTTPSKNGGAAAFVNADRLCPATLAEELYDLHALVTGAAGELPTSDTPEAWRVHRLCRMASERIAYMVEQLAGVPAVAYVPKVQGGEA